MGRPVSLQALILDSGALIAFERRDRRAAAFVQRAREVGARVIVPAGVVAQTWRDGSRQARIAALLASDDVEVDVLDQPRARAAGALCGRRRTSNVVDASLVVASREHRGVIVTSDPDDLHRLDPGIELAVI